MKPVTILTSLMILLLLVSVAQGVEETSWGQLKQQLTNGPAAKLVTSSYTLEDGTTYQALDASIYQSGAYAKGRSVVALFTPQGGTVQLDVNSGGKPHDNLRVDFDVPAGALTETVAVTMIVYGETLSELLVEFAPGGLEFLQHATLMLSLGVDRVDMALDNLTLFHIHDDGTVETAGIQAVSDIGANTVRIKVAVPGFSRYGLRY